MCTCRVCVTAIALLLMILMGRTSAEVPPTINVQGRLTDVGGAPVPPGPKIFEFKIYDSETFGTEIWPAVPGQEEHVIETDDGGLWNTQLGGAFPIPPEVFSDPGRWLEIIVDVTGTPDTLPRLALNTSPFSFYTAHSVEAGVAAIEDTGLVMSYVVIPRPSREITGSLA